MKAWEDFLTSLEETLGRETVERWLRPIRVVRFDAANLYLDANPFQRSFFDEHVPIRRFLNNNHRPIRIHWEKQQKTETAPIKPLSLFPADPLEKECRLELFIAAPANAMTLETAKMAASRNGSFNPIYFFGPSGSGKSHLLMGIAAALMDAGIRVFYVKTPTFTEHVVQAIRRGQMQDFRKTYRSIDALIVDDVHFLARKNACQEEFFHTFNALHTLGRLIILSANVPARELAEVEARLVSRFEWGVSLRLEPSDPSTNRKILEEKARLLRLDLPASAIDFLLSRFCSNLKTSIQALHALAMRPCSVWDATALQRSLADLLHKESLSLPSSDTIIRETAFYFGIKTEDLTGNSQMREFVRPRQIAMFLCRERLKMPYQAIGRLFHRDHSTVISSIRQVKKAIDENLPPLSIGARELSKTLDVRS